MPYNAISLKNLRPGDGRPPTYEKKKTRHNISVTSDSWKVAQKKVQDAGFKSISALVEALGREEDLKICYQTPEGLVEAPRLLKRKRRL